MEAFERVRLLNGNTLKIIALIAMTIDHVGLIIFPQAQILRIIGRLAFPIFAYMICEGAYYTRNKKKYFFLVLAVGIFCQIVMYIAARSLYQCILITFSFSILIIFSIRKIADTYSRRTAALQAAGSAELRQGAARDCSRKAAVWGGVTILLIAVAAFVCDGLPQLMSGTDFELDYGFWGVMLPVFIYIPNIFIKPDDTRNYLIKLPIFAAGLCMVAATNLKVQWWSLLSIILIALYNGQRGKINLKYLFYIYYPAHLGVLYLFGEILK